MKSWNTKKTELKSMGIESSSSTFTMMNNRIRTNSNGEEEESSLSSTSESSGLNPSKFYSSTPLQSAGPQCGILRRLERHPLPHYHEDSLLLESSIHSNADETEDDEYRRMAKETASSSQLFDSHASSGYHSSHYSSWSALSDSRSAGASSSSSGTTIDSGLLRCSRDLYAPKVIREEEPQKIHMSETGRLISSPTYLFATGGKFLRRSRVDILGTLTEIHADHVILKIFRYLRGQDITQVSKVCRKWNNIVKNYPEITLKRKEYLKLRKLDFENNGTEPRIGRLTPRKAMSNVSNTMSSPSSKRDRESSMNNSSASSSSSSFSFVSPSKIRHKLFSDEASKLEPGEQLIQCPRCTNPSRVKPSESQATCIRIFCNFNFCTACMCEVHENRPCRTLTSSSGKSSGRKCTVSTNKSKRRLRRL